jgi:cyclopropane fatty-acyl-phospholipid synthase-like methyltransferase
MMETQDAGLKEKLKERLFGSISAQIDAIGYVPRDIERLAGAVHFARDAMGEMPPVAPPAGGELSAPDRLARYINGHYDQVFYSGGGLIASLFSETDFRNIGYWDDSTADLEHAGRRLQDKLLASIPAKTGRILDVACGMGASTRRLLDHYPANDVWAINISERQIESTRANAPGCHAMVMNAVDLRFEDGFFDAILCIEAAFHFETRRRFLEEAHRVLKPGGRLVLSDVLFTSAERLEQYPVFPSRANHLDGVGAYRALLAEVGFTDIAVEDARPQVWGAHFMYVVRKAHEAFCAGRLDIVQLTEILWTYYHLDAITGACLFVHARKQPL